MIQPYTDLDGAARQREVIARMREQEAQKPAPTQARPNPHARHDFFEENKAEILNDYVTHGRAFMRKKWNISETAFDGLTRRRWADDIKRIRSERDQEQR